MRLIKRLSFALIVAVLGLLGVAPAAAAPFSSHWAQARITNTIVLGETSEHPPALWTAGDAAFTPAETTAKAILAWTGTDAEQSINLLLSHNGLDYAHKLVLPFHALAAPAVLVAHAEPYDYTIVAWTALDHHLNILFNVYGHQHHLRMADVSDFAPALTQSRDGQVWLAWTGRDSGQHLNVASFAIVAHDLVFRRKVTIEGYHSISGPGLAYDMARGVLMLSWASVGATPHHPAITQHIIDALTSPDGLSWSLLESQPKLRFSLHTPVLVANNLLGKSTLYAWMWTGTNTGDSLNVATTNNLDNWNVPNTVFAEPAFGAPAAGFAGVLGLNVLSIAWTGTDEAHHLNVAELRL